MNLIEKVDSEHVLISTFVVVSAWALVTASTFPARDAIFPQIAAAIILVGSLALLAIDLLPSRYRDIIATTDDIFNTSDMVEEGETDPENVDSRARHLLVGLIGGYLLLGYLVGLLWATPVFTLAYSVSTGQRVHVVAAQTLLSFAIAYGFMEILNLSIGQGALVGVL